MFIRYKSACKFLLCTFRLQPAAHCQARSSTWSPKPVRSPRPPLSGRHYHGGESDTNSISAGSQSSRQSVSTPHSSKPKVTPANSTKSLHQPETSVRPRRQPEIDQSCGNYVEPPRFVAEPLLSVVPTFIAPAAPAVPISLTNSTVVRQIFVSCRVHRLRKIDLIDGSVLS